MRAALRALFILIAAVLAAPAMTVQLFPQSGISANAAALAAFNRAAQTWSSVFSDPITVRIDVDLYDLGSPTIIGGADPTMLAGSYVAVGSLMVNDAADEASNGIVGYLPNTFSATYPNTFLLAGAALTQANAMALGVAPVTSSEGSIVFNSTFAFDYDNSNGVTPGTMDFETVALHEIGHILGFISVVDDIDWYTNQNQTTQSFRVTPLDMFRFPASSIPNSTGSFTSTSRMLTPGTAAVFSDGTNNWAMSTGKFTGDGRQASHWKDDQITSTNIGIMDPTLNYGAVWGLTSADIRSLDLIGYDVAVPEPGTFALIGLGLSAAAWRRQRRPQ